jgi:hypothetical protein
MSSPQDKTAGYESGPQSAGGPVAPTGQRETASYPEASDYPRGTGAGVAGFTILAATLMILSGLWSVFLGLTAIVKQSFFTSVPNYAFHYSIHGWGWTHLILGAVVFAAGFCVILGQVWARTVGILLAVLSAIANFMFLPYYPIWAIIVIAVDVFIIWALATGMHRSRAA